MIYVRVWGGEGGRSDVCVFYTTVDGYFGKLRHSFEFLAGIVRICH